jgi:hypothetical protein
MCGLRPVGRKPAEADLVDDLPRLVVAEVVDCIALQGRQRPEGAGRGVGGEAKGSNWNEVMSVITVST